MFTAGTYIPLKDLETMITPSSLNVAGLKSIALSEAHREKNVINVLCLLENGGPSKAEIQEIVRNLKTLLDSSGRTQGLFEVTESSNECLGAARFLYSDYTKQKTFIARIIRL